MFIEKGLPKSSIWTSRELKHLVNTENIKFTLLVKQDGMDGKLLQSEA